METKEKPTEQVCIRFTPTERARIRRSAEQVFRGVEVMLIREAVETYLDLREALGYDFDRTIQPLRVREVAEATA